MGALGSARTGTPDSSGGVKLAIVDAQQDNTIDMPVGVTKSDSLGAKPSAHRTGLSAVDAHTDLSTVDFGSANLFELNNDGTLIIWGESTAATQSITVRPIFYDSANAPLFEGPDVTMLTATRRVSAAGNFLSQASYPLDTRGARKVKLLVVSISGTWDLYVGSL